MARMKPIEKIAREYCWAGFAMPSKVGKSKAAYWRDLSEEKRGEYIKEASYFCYHVKRLGRETIETILAKNIE